MRLITKQFKGRVLEDLSLVILALGPAVISFFTDQQGITEDYFMRCGAVMAICSAFLEFRTHEIEKYRANDNIKIIWKTIGSLSEMIARVDAMGKDINRQISTLILSAGMEPVMGRPEDIKNMELSDRIKELKYLETAPESYYRYNSIVSNIGKVLVVLGTLVWAFSDRLMEIYFT